MPQDPYAAFQAPAASAAADPYAAFQQPASGPSIAGTASVMGNQAGRAAGAAWDTISSIPGLAMHPIDAMQKAFSYTADAVGRVKAAVSAGDKKQAVLSAVGAIPLAGPAAEQILREIDAGQYPEAIGHAAAFRMLAEVPGVPEGLKKAAPAASAAVDATMNLARSPGVAQILGGAGEAAVGAGTMVHSPVVGAGIAMRGLGDVVKGFGKRAAADAPRPASSVPVGAPAALPADAMRGVPQFDEMPGPVQGPAPQASNAQAYANGRPVVLQEDGTPLMYTDTAETPTGAPVAPTQPKMAQPPPAQAAPSTAPSAYEQHIAEVRKESGDVGAAATIAKDAKFADYVQNPPSGKGMTAADVDGMTLDDYRDLHDVVPTGKVSKAGKPTSFKASGDDAHLAVRKQALVDLMRDREAAAAKVAANPEGAAAATTAADEAEAAFQDAKTRQAAERAPAKP